LDTHENVRHDPGHFFGRGWQVRATEPPTDTGTAAGKALFDMLGKQAA
jgi:hypothetical protein